MSSPFFASFTLASHSFLFISRPEIVVKLREKDQKVKFVKKIPKKIKLWMSGKFS
jgi:hypothetical protein